MRSRLRLLGWALSLALIACAAASCSGDSSSDQPAGDARADTTPSGDGGDPNGGLLPIGNRMDGGPSAGSRGDPSVVDAGSSDAATPTSMMDSGSTRIDSGTTGCATATFGVSAFDESCFGD